MEPTKTRSPIIKFLVVLVGLILAVFTVLVAYRLVSGHSLGLRSFARDQVYGLTSRFKAVSGSDTVKAASKGEFTNIVFLHHSTGRNLIEQGQVRELFTEAGISFWDHDYNHIGLRDPNGSYLGYSYNVPNDNTDPDGLAEIFAQEAYAAPVNTLSGLLQHEVIAIKSCFPTSNITSDEQLAELKGYYLGMRDTVDKHPEKVFIILTQPPLNPVETTPEAGARARQLANWLGSDEFVGGRSNLYTFDFFDLLAEDDPQRADFNMLREAYRDGNDSHPNQAANEAIGAVFVESVLSAIEAYQ